MAGRFQAAHPNPSRLAPSGYFGSKFVTVIVTGKENGEIDFRGYQISNQVIISLQSRAHNFPYKMEKVGNLLEPT